MQLNYIRWGCHFISSPPPVVDININSSNSNNNNNNNNNNNSGIWNGKMAGLDAELRMLADTTVVELLAAVSRIGPL